MLIIICNLYQRQQGKYKTYQAKIKHATGNQGGINKYVQYKLGLNSM